MALSSQNGHRGLSSYLPRTQPRLKSRHKRLYRHSASRRYVPSPNGVSITHTYDDIYTRVGLRREEGLRARIYASLERRKGLSHVEEMTLYLSWEERGILCGEKRERKREGEGGKRRG
jgi:hypothetical protein